MDVLTLLDQLRMIARNGLNYTRDGYDRTAYELWKAEDLSCVDRRIAE